MTDLTPDIQQIISEPRQWRIDAEEFRRERDAAVAAAAILRHFVEGFTRAERLNAGAMAAWQTDAFAALREAEQNSPMGNEE